MSGLGSYDVSSSGGFPSSASQWHSLRISSTSWMLPLAETRRPAGAQGAPALRPALFLGTGLPECEPHGVARDVLHCIHDGQEAADQVPGIDHAVVDFLLDDRCRWRRRRLRLAEQAEDWMPRIGGSSKEWMRGSGPRRFFLKRRPKRLSGSNRLNNGRRLRLCLGSPVLLRGTLGPVDAGRLGCRLHHDVARRGNDEPPDG